MDIKKIILEAKQAIEACTNINEVNNTKSQFIGKKGKITDVLSSLKDASVEIKKTIGKDANMARGEISKIAAMHILNLQAEMNKKQLEEEKIDIFMPESNLKIGSLHPLTVVTNEIAEFFHKMGFEINFGQEVEEIEYNFDKLNLPADHPARSDTDTFYTFNQRLLRTHCTNITARNLSKWKKDAYSLKVIGTGNVYRNDEDDATHSHQFKQIDGFHVGEGVSFANLKWTLLKLSKHLFGEETKIRLRPSFFPFTEPSVEVDISCFKCQGNGCGICKQTGWIEILGAGMLNPKVLENCGVDSSKYNGYAFGIGIDRVAMLKYGIEDIRNIYKNNVEFIREWVSK